MDHDQLRELTGAYALGALGDHERHAVDAHLRDCPECAREARSLVAVAHALAHTTEPLEPPASLRERVLRAAASPSPASDAPEVVEPQARPATLPAWLAIAASIVAVVAGGYAWTLRARVASLEAQLAAATAARTDVERRLVSLESEVQGVRRSAAILAAADVRRIELAGQPVSPDATGRAFWSPSRGVVFSAARLPAAPAGTVYQLWMVTPARPVGIALLTPGPDGEVIAVVPTPADVTTLAAMAVTLEPAGGVPAPTGEKYLVGTTE